MSAAWRAGSTRSWRKLRAYVLARDGRLCQVPDGDGRLCLAPARHVDHIKPRSAGGAFLDPANCRAACEACNLRRGAARPPKPRRAWSW